MRDRYLRVVVIAWLAIYITSAWGQEASEKAVEKADAPEQISLETVDQGIQTVESSADLEDVTKALLKTSLQQARAALERAQKLRDQATRYTTRIENVEADRAKTTTEKDGVQAYDLSGVANQSLNELNAAQADLEEQLSDARRLLQEAQAEPQRRVERRAAIPGEIAASRASADSLRGQIEELPTGDSASVATRTQSMLLQAQLQRELANIDKLDLEGDLYQAQGELPRLQVDALTARVRQLEDDTTELAKEISERRRSDAAEQEETTKLALESAPPALKPFAEINDLLASRRNLIAETIAGKAEHDGSRAARDQTNRVLNQWQQDLRRTQQRTLSLNKSSLGQRLVDKRSDLPSIARLTRDIARGEVELGELQQNLYVWEDRRTNLSDLDSIVDELFPEDSKEASGDRNQLRELLATKTQFLGSLLKDAKNRTRLSDLDSAVDSFMDEKEDSGDGDQLRDQLRELLVTEAQLLDSLLKDANQEYGLRIATNDNRRKTIAVTREYQDFIDGQIFWMPTANPLSVAELSHSIDAWAWLLKWEVAERILYAIRDRLFENPGWFLLMTALIAAMLFYRGRLRSDLERNGKMAAGRLCRSIAPTVRALFDSILLALPGPAALWTFGWVLDGSAIGQTRAMSGASYNAAWLWLELTFVRQLWCPEGLAESHFDWPTTFRSELNRRINVLILFGTPLLFFGSLFQLQTRSPQYRDSVGRLCLVAFLVLVAWSVGKFLYELRPGGQLDAAGRWKKLAARLAVISPLVLAIWSIVGYHYTTMRLTLDCIQSAVLILSCAVIRALLFRAVRVTRRRIRWKQLTETQPTDSTTELPPEASDFNALMEKEVETDLSVMDRQTRRLIDLTMSGVLLIGLIIIWLEVLPAFRPLMDLPLNPFRLIGDVTPVVTIGSALLALAIVAATATAWKNIPGLIDALLLGRLGVESSIRYAITTLSQYGIAIVGIIIACNTLGLTWDSMQWLVAAMGVGLGFGLQEVVSNFICGIILLFERPIRVGDIVTLTDTTGVVIRIRSRATTVRNWDRQEVVIPNKELITGRITNWTLSDGLNRIVIPIGVAYGADTDRVRSVLMDLLTSHPKVMDDPAPLVTFEEFADSSIRFIARSYIDNMDDRLETIHQLYSMIHERFREEGIEIAFTQTDLHLRSVDPSIMAGRPTTAAFTSGKIAGDRFADRSASAPGVAIVANS